MRTSLLLSLLLLAAPASAQKEATIGPAPERGPRLSPAAERQLTEGIDRLYSLDYEQSRAAFRKLIELEPDNPWGYLFEAGGIWWQSSQEYGLFKDTPTLQGLFEQDVEAALRKAEAYIDDKKDARRRADGYFVSGMTLGTRGQWNLMKGKWVAAYLDGKKAVKHLNKCVKLDDEYYDAYLGLGLFDYQAARFSGIIRFGAALTGMRGDEKRGLERIHLAVDKARYANRQAAQLLANTYIVDFRDDARALPVLQKLRGMFPSSVYFVFLEACARHRLGDWDGSVALGRELFAAASADPAAFRRKELTLACGLAGADCLNKADAERLLSWTTHALESVAKEKAAPKPPASKARPAAKGAKPAPKAKPEPPDAFPTWVHLLRAHALELLGRREEAEGEFKKAAAGPDFDGAHARAKACLAAPCGRDVLLKLLRDRSKPAGS
jgi:tetratricopeptide (TPR) repeat protein